MSWTDSLSLHCAIPVGEDEVSHVVVYDTETFHPNHAFARPNYRQNYLCGDAWIEVYFRIEVGGNPSDYVAVISAASSDSPYSGREVGSVNIDVDERGSKEPMFVDGVQLFEQSERISPRLIPIPSLIRLYRIYDVTELSDRDAEVKEWWEGRRKSTFVERLIRIELTDEACWIERRVIGEVRVDGFQMLMCPLELEDRPFKRMGFTPQLKFHGVQSAYERRTETEDGPAEAGP